MSFQLSNAWKWSRAKVFLQRVANELYKIVFGSLTNISKLIYWSVSNELLVIIANVYCSQPRLFSER